MTCKTYPIWFATCRRLHPNGALVGDQFLIMDIDVGHWDRAAMCGTIRPDRAVAFLLSEAVNHGIHYTGMQRNTISASLSLVVKRLGAIGVDKAVATSGEEVEDES